MDRFHMQLNQHHQPVRMMGVRQNKSNSRPFSRITLAWVSIQLSTLFLVPVALNSLGCGRLAGSVALLLTAGTVG